MKTIPTLLFLLSGLLSINTYAGACPLQKDGPVLEAYSKQDQGAINCEYVTDVESVFTDILAFSEERVSVNLFVQNKYDNASFDGGTIIEVPEQLVFFSPFGQEFPVDLVSNLSTVAHEYGHALLEKKLEKALLKEFPAEAGFISANQEISKLKILALKVPTEENKKLLEEKNAALLANKSFLRFASIMTPYSELYADVVAVYVNNDKSAIFRALYYEDMNDLQFRMVQTRDFNSEFTSRHNMFMGEAHGFFALTRNYIGKNLWPSTNAEKQVMLKKIGDAILEEVRALLVSGKELPSFEAANKLLIKRLK